MLSKSTTRFQVQSRKLFRRTNRVKMHSSLMQVAPTLTPMRTSMRLLNLLRTQLTLPVPM